jgi:RES domain-containing protein
MAIDLDKNRIRQSATVETDTILFRIVYQKFATQSKLLNGQDGRWTQGRYNFRGSLTSYVADNALLCIAESLYHISRRAALHLRQSRKVHKSSVDFWRSIAATDKILVAFKSSLIKNLIYIDSEDSRYHVATKAGKVLHPSTVLNPDFIYKPLQQVAKLYRNAGRRGIVYPSRNRAFWQPSYFLESNRSQTQNTTFVDRRGERKTGR